jgi:hypothetical protein
MPWFQIKGRSGSWTHWVDTIPRQSYHFTTLIGLYDSRDPDVLEYQVLEMKYAGLDGLFMDWYGINNGLPEYGSQPIFAILAKAGLKYAMVWEDRYANNQGGATPVLQFMENNFFRTNNYLKSSNRPILLVWQITYLTGAQWQTNMNSVSFQNKPILVTRDNALTPAAEGAYSWINAAGGTSAVLTSLSYFLGNAWTYMIPTALPRFVDDYPGFSYGTIDDQAGQTFVNTLTRCLQSNKEIVQIATWNDWQEGTIVEPSVEFQYRDLEVVQNLRKKFVDATFSYMPDQLRLPVRIFKERKQFKGNVTETARLDSAANALFQGNPAAALNILNKTAIVRPAAMSAKMSANQSGMIVYDLSGRRVDAADRLIAQAKGHYRAVNSGVYILTSNSGPAAVHFISRAH